MSTERAARAWIEVDASSLRRNLSAIRARIGPEPALIPMVKADGYGLGMGRAVAALEPLDPWGYGVATVREGETLRRQVPEKPILVFGGLPPGSYDRAVASGLTVCVSDVSGLQRLQEAADRHDRTAAFHLEVDTGMGRFGFDWRLASEWAEPVAALASSERLRWEGCFTHFHSADEQDPITVRTQWDRFRDVTSSLRLPEEGVMLHGCNSAAALRFPELGADAVRPGIHLYGGRAGEELQSPEPVATVRARVVHVRDASPGTTVGYGGTHVAREWERWATVTIGYGDGLPCLLGNRGEALVGGRRVRIVGRISMDVTVVDISGMEDVEPGDPVTFLGRDGEEEITLDEVAAVAKTISYEILTGLGPRLPRVWVDRGER